MTRIGQSVLDEPVNSPEMTEKVTCPKLVALKSKGQKLVCVTAYDAVTTAIADAAGVDVILVGDSIGNVVLGYENTLPVTMEEMLIHIRAAKRANPRALLVGDLPFGSYQSSVDLAVESAVEMIKAGAEAVKLEGPDTAAIQSIVAAGIPVMGHVGMTPQFVNVFGGFKVQGRGDQASKILEDARAVEASGAFSIVLELIPAVLAGEITGALEIPTIGIGAGPHCDGQIQVFHDLVGLSPTLMKHTKRYTMGRRSFVKALRKYTTEVRGESFPLPENSF